MRYRWVVLAAGTFAQATYSAIWFGAAVMAPALRDRYHLSLGEVGVLISTSLAGSVLSLVPWGLATDRIGERAGLVTGLGTCGLALLGASQAASFAALALLLGLAGLAGASVHSASGRAVMHWFAPSQRGLALGIRQTAVPISGFAAALGLPAIARAGGVGWGFATLGIACLAGAATAGALLREGPPLADDPGAAARGPLRDRRIWILSGGSALVLAPQMCVVGFAVLFLHDQRGLSAGEAGVALAVMQGLGVGARIGAGRWSDVLASRIVPLRRIALACATLVALTAALVSAPTVFLLPALVAAGVLSMSWNALSFAAAAELAGGARSGAAIGLQQTVLNVAGTFLPGLFGLLVAHTTWRSGFAVVALFPLAGWRVLRDVRG